MSVTRIRPEVPEELPKLLHDFSYAVIKNNPTDIISFAADFFQQLYDEREGQPTDKLRHSRKPSLDKPKGSQENLQMKDQND